MVFILYTNLTSEFIFLSFLLYPDFLIYLNVSCCRIFVSCLKSFFWNEAEYTYIHIHTCTSKMAKTGN